MTVRLVAWHVVDTGEPIDDHGALRPACDLCAGRMLIRGQFALPAACLGLAGRHGSAG